MCRERKPSLPGSFVALPRSLVRQLILHSGKPHEHDKRFTRESEARSKDMLVPRLGDWSYTPTKLDNM
jgi:hypothetical protein